MSRILFDGTKESHTDWWNFDYLQEDLNSIDPKGKLLLGGIVSRWDGYNHGFEELKNAGDMLYSRMNTASTYLVIEADDERKEINITECHHDGCNHYQVKIVPKNTNLNDYSYEKFIKNNKRAYNKFVKVFDNWLNNLEEEDDNEE